LTILATSLVFFCRPLADTNLQDKNNFFIPSRTIIFAPHPDDETLGAGGIIYSLSNQGKEVKVVFVTNGESYTQAFERWDNPIDQDQDKDIDLVDFGYERQNEAMQASAILGLSPRDLIFLGYPSGQLMCLWEKNWEYGNLHFSNFACSNQSPYSNSYSSAPYCGMAVVNDIKNILYGYNPSIVYITTLRDNHLDHKATNLFVKQVIRELMQNYSDWNPPLIQGYTIHRGTWLPLHVACWPYPSGYHPNINLFPPLVMPSPNIPTPDAAAVYPGQVLFEGTNIAEGRGTTRPFEIFGAPWIDGYELTKALNGLNLPGVRFREVWFTPAFSKYAGELCGGSQIHIMDKEKYNSFETGLHIINTVKKLYPDQFKFESNYFDKLCGNSWVREDIEADVKVENIVEKYQQGLVRFEELRKEYLLYE
jgi:LmbE family N-acetylglucosaminyl deacetylase